MLMFIIALSASIAAPSISMRQPISSADAVKRAIGCGVANSEVRVRYDSDLQDDVIEITAKSAHSAEQYECVANTSYETGYDVDFKPPFREDYRRVFGDIQKSRNALEARERLKVIGILDKVPHFDGNNLPAVAAKVEAICGIKPRTALWVSGENIALQSERLTGLEADSEFICLMDGLLVAGVQMGFAGNEVTPTSADEAPRPKL